MPLMKVISVAGSLWDARTLRTAKRLQFQWGVVI